ncbi:hypothetical protein N7532_000949 [Penicillium argentinense]|uniref:Glutathione synthetase n=1 Tax=Penicillium argentinense TaxID=1131581 RepID=A0A9W9KKT1_9EURO|nr:uncharacterized protein N7532_000949 [Penicillium argentinense]KAJ5110414.1 hypothetical protein N7532_000949 [Penicillium argentinense]
MEKRRASLNREAETPSIDETHGFELVRQIRDWQINNGALFKSIADDDQDDSGVGYAIGVTVFPSPFPWRLFEQARTLQPIYNKLYCAIAEDPDWIYSQIKDLIPVDPLVHELWDLYQAARQRTSVQPISAGVFRSDYMLNCGTGSLVDPQDEERIHSTRWDQLSQASLKQVEFNTYFCAGFAHAERVAKMHQYLARTGAYNLNGRQPFHAGSMPLNHNVAEIASLLALAHETYGFARSKFGRKTAILFVVQPHNVNTTDERPIEYALADRDIPVSIYRVWFGHDVLACTSLTEEQALLFTPPGSVSEPVEISVVYMRAGLDASEYFDDSDMQGCNDGDADLSEKSRHGAGWYARLQLEQSAAIKCPSVLGHMATLKRVQQALTVPGALERFLDPDEASQIRTTFVRMYPLDKSENGLCGRAKATDPEQARHMILKPSQEGGGHNVYGEEIPEFLKTLSQVEWSRYILMERIMPPPADNFLLGRECAGYDTISELGVLGCCLWRKEAQGHGRCEIFQNWQGGWTFKTKPAGVDEMSVVKGFGCFDSLRLLG